MSTALDPAFARTWSETWPVALLLSARVLPLAWLVPTAAGAASTWLSASAIGLALGACLLPLAMTTPHPELMLDGSLFAALIGEVLRGLVFALAVCLPLHAFGWNGTLAERLRGSLDVDSAGPEQEAPLAALYRYGAIAVLFAGGAHLLVLDALASGLSTYPLGSMPDMASAGSVARASVSLVSHALVLSVELCAPVLLGLLVLTLLLGVVSRVSAPIGAALQQSPIAPTAGLGMTCLVAAVTLPEAETALRVFLRQAEALLRSLG
jgi:type III secretory pathway component EscT